MNQQKRELLVYQILVGYIKCEINNRTILITSPTITDLLDSQQIYIDSYNDAIYEGLFNENEYLRYLLDNELWSVDEEAKLGRLPKEIDNTKLEMFENNHKSNTLRGLREVLKEKKEELEKLFNKKFSRNYLTAEGIATLARSYFMIGRCIKYDDFSSLKIDFDEPKSILDDVIIKKNKYRVTESQIRDLARHEPWKSYWACGNIFNKPSIELTEEQKNIILMSKMYDNIQECPDAPAQWIIDDDDLLDGWLISHKAKKGIDEREAEFNRLVSNPKIANSDIIFIPAETIEDARKIDDLNTPEAKMIKQERFKQMEKSKDIAEQNFLDSKLKIMNQLAKERK